MKQIHTQMPMNITIPAAIAGLNCLNLTERVALAHIHEYPGSSNAVLARRLGLSVRGVEDLLKRLRQQGYVKLSGESRARTHQLTFDVPTDDVGNAKTVDAHENCGGESKTESSEDEECSLADFAEVHLNAAANCIYQLHNFDAALEHYRLIRERMLKDKSLAPEALGKCLERLTRDENKAIAAKLGLEIVKARKLPHQKQVALAKMLCLASPVILRVKTRHLFAGQNHPPRGGFSSYHFVRSLQAV